MPLQRALFAEAQVASTARPIARQGAEQLDHSAGLPSTDVGGLGTEGSPRSYRPP
jgi:hypothetical protein